MKKKLLLLLFYTYANSHPFIDVKYYNIELMIVAFFFIFSIILLIMKRKKELTIQSLILNLGEGVYGVDKKGNCIWINKIALNILGYKEDEVVGKNQHLLFHFKKRSGEIYLEKDCPIYKTIKDKKTRTCNEYFITKNGKIIPVKLTISPFNRKGSIVIFRDITKEQEDEKEKKEKENQLNTIIKTLPDMLVIYNINLNKIVKFNDNIYLTLNYNKREFEKIKLEEIIYLKNKDESFKILKDVDYEINEYRTKYLKKDKSTIDVELNVSSILIGKIRYKLIIAKDITHKLFFQKKIEENSNLLEKISLKMPGVFFIYRNRKKDKNKELSFISQNVNRFFNLKDEEKRNLQILFSKLTKKSKFKVLKYISLANKTISSGEIEFKIKDKNDNYKWFNLSANLVIESNEKVTWYCYIQDITENKVIKKEISIQKRKLEMALSSSQIGVWEWNLEKNIINWDKNCFSMLGYENEEFILNIETWLSLVQIKNKSKFKKLIYKYLKNKKNFLIKVEMKNNFNNNKWIELRGKVIKFDKYKNPIKVIGIQNDINLLKRHEETLKKEVYNKTLDLKKLNLNLENKINEEIKKNREKDLILQNRNKLISMGEMIGNIAHQWRQPLSAITSAVSGFKLKNDFDLLKKHDIDELYECVSKNATYLSNTIDDFRNFFKQEKKNEIFNIKDLIIKSVNIIESSLKNNNIRIALFLDETIFYNGNKNLLSQVIINLLSNAKDILINKSDERNIIVKLSRDDNNLYVEVSDNAGGVPPKLLEKIFEPYFTTKHQSQGTGLGLYMSLEIIKNHFNGTINVINTEIGACFNITIPIENQHKQEVNYGT